MNKTKIASAFGLVSGILVFAPIIGFDISDNPIFSIASLLSGTLTAWLIHLVNKKGILETNNLAVYFLVPCSLSGVVLFASLLFMPEFSLLIYIVGMLLALVVLFPAIEPKD